MTGIENQVLILSLGIHGGMVLTQFFDALTRDVILPMFSRSEEGASKFVIQIGSLKIKLGDILVQIINMMIAFGVVYVTVPYIKEYVPIAGRR
jgi:large-conductance mechanosensitive channel